MRIDARAGQVDEQQEEVLESANGFSWLMEKACKEQVRLLQLIASKQSFNTLLDSMICFVQEFATDMRCCILIADLSAGVLRVGSAPDLPPVFVHAIDGTAIGEGEGACGTAAARRELVIVDDIATSPLWARHREAARAAGLAACWSMPLFDNNDGLIGTFAIYFSALRAPEPPEVELLRVAASLAGIAIQRFRDAELLQTNELRYRELAERCPDSIIAHVNGNVIFLNHTARALLHIDQTKLASDIHLEEFTPEHLRDTLLSHRTGVHSAQLRASNGQLLHVEIAANELTMDHQLATVWVARDVNRRLALDNEIFESENRQQEQLAFDLHDGLGQQLTGISLMLRGLNDTITPTHPAAMADFKTLAELVSKSISDIRVLAGSMSPVTVERAGLAGALKTLWEKAQRIYGLDARLSIQPASGWTLDGVVAAHLFRIAQEAIANVARHAKAKHVSIDGRVDGAYLVITITDDGIGIRRRPDRETGLGLRGMKYRSDRIGAQLTIEPHSPQGTTVRVKYPWKQAGAAPI